MFDQFDDLTPTEIGDRLFWPVSLAVFIMLALAALVGILAPELRNVIGCASGFVVLAFVGFVLYLFCFDERKK